MVQDFATTVTQHNLRFMYLFGIPAYAGVLLCGGIRRTFQGRAAYYWTGFALWMLLATPFSSYKGGSVNKLIPYFWHEYTMLFVIAGLALTWKDCKRVMWAVALAAACSVLWGILFRSATSDRLRLEFGIVANPNDFAAHLLLVLPFLFWVILSSKSWLARLAALAPFLYGFRLIMSTASRGAVVGLAAASIFFLLRGTGRQRLALVVLVPILLGVLVTSTPAGTLRRITSFSSASEDGSAEALASSKLRKVALEKSIEYAVQHPLFGVGPGEFGDYIGMHNIMPETDRGMWIEPHNTYTQVASEAGFPALFFFVAGFVSTFRSLNAVYRKANRRGDSDDIRDCAFCIMLGLIGFCVATAFLSFAYYFYGPALAGIAIAVSRAAEAEFAGRDAQIAQTPALPGRSMAFGR
jgi:O-antigen ligase